MVGRIVLVSVFISVVTFLPNFFDRHTGTCLDRENKSCRIQMLFQAAVCYYPNTISPLKACASSCVSPALMGKPLEGDGSGQQSGFAATLPKVLSLFLILKEKAQSATDSFWLTTALCLPRKLEYQEDGSLVLHRYPPNSSLTNPALPLCNSTTQMHVCCPLSHH